MPGPARVLVFAIGNTLRGDDGVAHRVADLLGERAGVQIRRVHQLTPELAEEFSNSQVVIFVDADATMDEVRLELLPPTRQPPPITHILRPGELLAIARRLFDFGGAAYLCHVPAKDFTPGAPLTPTAEAGARAALEAVRAILEADPPD